MLEKTPPNSYRVYHVDAAGQRVDHTNFTAVDDGAACDNALSLQEKGGWPAIELWVNHRQVPCEAAPTDVAAETKTTNPGATWGRRIATGYLPRAEQLRAEAARMTNPKNKQAMLNLAANYEQLANSVSKSRKPDSDM
jgi:hypothetical protein